jgi:transcriptional regulator with XRE-family HTH domain
MARKQSALTRVAVAQKAGVSDAIVGYLETNQRLPTVGTIARLASALGVSAAWLAYGLGESTSQDAAATCDQMGARLGSARDERKISRAELARLTKLSPGTIAKIENSGSSGVHVVEALAQALGISPGWLAFGIGDRELPPTRRGRPRAQSPDPA